ncbi:MAG: CBS domain-containing protein [Phycisphaerae bacterium]|nr:CBS domain-containing protein [Phycisphaerae bacterium]
MATVADVLSIKGNKVVCAMPEMSVREAAKIMHQNHIGSVIVTENERVVGVFTERDVLNRVVAADKDPSKTLVRDVMTSPVACGTPDTSLGECRTVMTRNRIRHLPIVEHGRLVGIISSGDLMAREVREQQATIHYLHEYIHGRV